MPDTFEMNVSSVSRRFIRPVHRLEGVQRPAIAVERRDRTRISRQGFCLVALLRCSSWCPADGQKMPRVARPLRKRSDLCRILAEYASMVELGAAERLGPALRIDGLFTAVCCEIAQPSRDISAHIVRKENI